MSTPSDRTRSPLAGEGPRSGGNGGSEQGKERPSVRPGSAESLVGEVLGGRYHIERLIGEGGMGAVYQAEHTHMRKRLAVKVLHPEMGRLPEVVARFEREAMAAANIEHPNVAGATDFGKLEDGSFFLVLEYVEGTSLRDAIREGRMPLERALHIVRQIASALARAHALGIVHRDLKPENIMLVQRESDASFVKVLDFGIAKVPVGEFVGDPQAPGQALTQLGMVYGTPEYMAPEQALGQPVDARADLYALGVMAFEMITGTRPYRHESKVTLLGMHVTAPIPRMTERAPEANVPPEIEAIVTRLLAKEAPARFVDARSLIEALDAAAPASIAVAPTRFADRPPPAATPGPRLASLVGASLRVAIGGAPSWARSRRAVLVAAALGLSGLVVVAIRASGGGGPAPAGSAAVSAGVSATTGSARPPDVKTEAVLAAAQATIERGDFATAIDALTALEKKGPDRADVHMLLERAYTGVRNTREAMREAALLLTADSNAAVDLKLQEDIRNAALLRGDTQDEGFTLLESRMGSRGIDILYDIAFGTSGRLYPQAAARAKRSFDLAEVRGRASAPLAVLLEFRDAKTCDDRRALLERARDQGDARLLPMLEPYQATRGCGFLGRSDCYPCMHKDRQLSEAMGAIQARGR